MTSRSHAPGRTFQVFATTEQYGEGYAQAIANTFGTVSVSMAQRQLHRFERAGLLSSAGKGKTRLFTWNPRYPFSNEVRQLLANAHRIGGA